MANTLTFANRTITDAELFGDIAYTADLNDGDELTIGNTASASAEFVTDIQLPLYTSDAVNGIFAWTKDSTAKGRYYITEVTKEDGFYTVTAYDAMILLETNVSALSLTFPLSVSAAASAIATYIGCTVSGTIYNGSLTVSALDDNMTIRELLGYVAEASGCSVKIDGSDHLCFMYYEDSGITLTASDYKKINIADYSCTAIDRVTIFDSYGNLKAEAGSGDNALYIQGNPFLEEAQTAAAQAILGNVSGIVYTPLTCELFDEEGLEIGTMATFGTTQTLIMHLESSESGAMAQSVGSDTRAEYNKSVDIVANEARVLAEAALETAENTDQYFWMASTGSDTGVHITEIPRADFLDDPQNGGANLLARSNGIAIRDGVTELATFGADGIVLGNDESMRAEIDSNSFELKDIHGESWFKVEDQRDPDGTKTFTETVIFTSDEDVEDLTVRHPLYSVTSLTLFNSVTGYTTIPSDQYTFTQDSYTIEILGEGGIGYIEVEAGDHITIVYKSDVDDYRSYTLGSRATGLVGKSSYVLGYNCTAQQDYATAIGEGTNTGNSHEVVVGKYNGDANASGALYHRVYAFEVGNGTDDENRSNAFAVDWDGYVDHYNDGVFEIPSAVINASTGTFVSGQFARYGSMVQMQITFRNTASTASGSNIFECSFDPQTPSSWLPVISARGCGYYGAHALIATITSAGKITIRNASSSALTISASNSTTVTFTYICDPHR